MLVVWITTWIFGPIFFMGLCYVPDQIVEVGDVWVVIIMCSEVMQETTTIVITCSPRIRSCSIAL